MQGPEHNRLDVGLGDDIEYGSVCGNSLPSMAMRSSEPVVSLDFRV